MLQGTASPEALVKRAAGLNLPAMVLTDTNGMYGLISFIKYCLNAGIKPIPGTYIDDPSDSSKYILLLPRNNQGYSDMCKIITTRKLNDDFSLEYLIGTDLRNLFVITPDYDLLNTYGHLPNVFAELIGTKSKNIQTRKLYELVSKKKLKPVPSYPVYFLNNEDYLIHKIVTAIRLNKNLSNLEENEIQPSDFYFSDRSNTISKWKKVPGALENLEYIINECNTDLQLNKFKFPVFPDLKGETSDSVLWKESFRGLSVRYNPVSDEARKRLEYELQVIKELNFSDYFLIVQDILKEAKRRGMLTIGRGSAANSLVSYCLGLTEVDPIRHNLYFERFLNKARSSPPDVDIDFSWKERDEIIRYVFDKYGYENVAMISTHVTFKARSAFREVAKIYGISEQEISTYSKQIPWTRASNLPDISERFPESRNLDFKIEPWKSVVEAAARLSDFPRHLSIHPGGIVITPGPITDFTALEYAKNKGLGLIITQPDMYSIEELGLIKIDLLSQRSLGVLRDTLSSIENGN
ncbi:MAG: hypothetical protein Kow0098_27390 [Ignavibacteriaceae bacterium]